MSGEHEVNVPVPDAQWRAEYERIVATPAGRARERDAHLFRYRLDDGLFPGTLAEAADRLSWSYCRLLVHAGVGRLRRRLRRMMRS